MKIFTSIFTVFLVIVLGVVFLTSKNAPKNTELESVQNTQIVDGKQIIEIKAKGGYHPRTTLAKAGIPTVLRISTDGTFDCSAALRIPALSISEILPNSGTKEIDLGTSTLGTLEGNCGMGMYPFEIVFES